MPLHAEKFLDFIVAFQERSFPGMAFFLYFIEAAFHDDIENAIRQISSKLAT